MLQFSVQGGSRLVSTTRPQMPLVGLVSEHRWQRTATTSTATPAPPLAALHSEDQSFRRQTNRRAKYRGEGNHTIPSYTQLTWINRRLCAELSQDYFFTQSTSIFIHFGKNSDFRHRKHRNCKIKLNLFVLQICYSSGLWRLYGGLWRQPPVYGGFMAVYGGSLRFMAAASEAQPQHKKSVVFV